MSAASVDREYESRTVARARPSGLEIVLLKRTYVLPWSQFLYAEGGDDEIRLVFATHDVVVTGNGLSSILTELAEQSIGRLNEPSRADRLETLGATRIREIRVERQATSARKGLFGKSKYTGCRYPMESMPTNQYVEVRNGAYYVAGTRIGLDVIVYEFRDGRTADAIFEAYPSVGSLAKVYGVITFILEHPGEIEAYLAEQDRRYEEIKARYPLPPDMIERFERGMRELHAKRS
jgi:uncharacterized protein (DUF433 family)